MDMELEELSHDAVLIARMKTFRDSTLKIEETVKLLTGSPVYEELTKADKIKHDLLLSYTLNSLFWMYLRAEGIDPSKHKVKAENERLKRSMGRAKQINDRNLLRPRVNKGLVQKFVRNSLWQAKSAKVKVQEENSVHGVTVERKEEEETWK